MPDAQSNLVSPIGFATGKTISILAISKPVFSLDSYPRKYDRLDVMRKVWVYKRKSANGWWVGWYESGKRKAKALPSKALAEHYSQIKYTQLNSDVFTGTVTVDWAQMLECIPKCM